MHINVEERLKLETILFKLLEKKADFDQLYFWGKVEGQTKDYYIAMGLSFNTYEFPKKTFYYS